MATALPVAGFLAAVYLLAGEEVAHPDHPGSSPGRIDPLPASFVGLPIVEAVTGRAAIDDVARLHGTEIPVARAAVGRYAASGTRAEVWASGVPHRRTATEMVRRMVEGIEGGGTPFDPPRRLGDRPRVWATSGLGQRHLFFARNDTVWWVSIDPGLERRALAELAASGA